MSPLLHSPSRLFVQTNGWSKFVFKVRNVKISTDEPSIKNLSPQETNSTNNIGYDVPTYGLIVDVSLGSLYIGYTSSYQATACNVEGCFNQGRKL